MEKKIRFKTWYVVDGGWDVLRHERRRWKDYEVDMTRRRGTGIWEFTIKKGNKVISEYRHPTKRSGIKRAREIIAKEEGI